MRKIEEVIGDVAGRFTSEDTGIRQPGTLFDEFRGVHPAAAWHGDTSRTPA